MTTRAETEKPERLFIAVPLFDAARARIRSQLPAQLPGRAVPSDNWHFTLRFLGATSPEIRNSIIADLSDQKLGHAFDIRFNELGAFPNPRRPRVLWLGVDTGAERMIELATIAEAVARRAGFEAEKRKFTPHLTLARLDPPRSVAGFIGQVRIDVEARVDRIVLYRSKLGGGPARYEVVQTFLLSTPFTSSTRVTGPGQG